ncbi:TDP-N-acetylfucosamine:lipid II N-acetylfucosaminyltransferase [Cetobacterium sp.]|uniref:TDP-N-acetylfucosamine:lipid II N-acetylfucosaminyltransferase n=1 Tax=Cetobacterium sp. TaxID=2071632 RepID=UPI003F3D628D
MKKILHVMGNDKFINNYIEFVNKNFDENHLFYIIKGVDYLDVPDSNNVIYFKYKKENFLRWYIGMILIYIKLWFNILKFDKVIFHSLGNNYTILFLFLNPWILKKSNWIIWGGDLYSYYERINSGIIRKVFYKIENFVKGNLNEYTTHVEGDYKLAKELFGAKGKYNNCFMYLSNIYQERKITQENKKEIWIQIGNSAEPSNNHLEIIDKLEKFRDEKIQLVCPLSYGDKEWAKSVIDYGKSKFGDKFIPITDYMKFEEYIQFLSKVDIAIFAHDRQQAVGNITSLLSMEKTVYLKKEVTTYGMLEDLGVEIGDFLELDNLNLFSIEDRQKNKEIIKRRFSEERLKEDLEKIFNPKKL